MPRRRLRVGERVGHAHALDRLLRHAVQHRRRLDADGLEDRRIDVDHVMELRADAALVLDPRRPRDDHAVARAAEVRRDLLGPLERRVHRVRPADRIVVEGHRPAELVHAAQHFREVLRDVVEERHLVQETVRAALGARAVVALDVDDERVVELAQLVDRIDHAAHLVVGVRERGGVDLHHVGGDLLVVGVERVPRRNAGGALGELRARGHDAELLLPRERLLAHLVPALVELALELRDPLLRRVVRRVRGAGRVVDEPRLLRRDRVQHPDAVDRVVGHVVVEEVVLRVVRRLDRLDVLDERGTPLVGVAADEAVEVFEARAPSATGRTDPPGCRASRARCGSCRTRPCCSRSASAPRRRCRRSSASACCSRGSRCRPP